MRIALTIIIGIHGIIHLFGFLKSFEFSEFKALSQTISKPFGFVWLMAFILFAISFILLAIKNNYWWLFGIIAVVVSQILVIYFWKDTKFGTVLNIVILLASIIAFANFNFTKLVNTEVSQMSSKIALNKNAIVSSAMITKLPIPVQNWLQKSGIIGCDIIQSVYLKQNALMKMKPEQKEWYKAEAEQYFITQEPSFHWTVDLEMNPFIKVVGRDKFEQILFSAEV